MMLRHKEKILVMLGALFSVMIWWGSVTAQDEIIIIEHSDVFTDMKRPPVQFPHALHEESLSKEGCGACHHIVDKEKNELVYEEGEEAECKTCHSLTKKEGTPALKEAFHKSCTGCHRQLKKSDPRKKGPTTCGECHPKHSK